MINWLQKWYIDHCDGGWEHDYGIKIYTIDNPGWVIEIELSYTRLANIEIQYQLFENSENDWYEYSIKDDIFKGAGDMGKIWVRYGWDMTEA